MAFSLFAIILVNIGGFKSVAWTDFLQGILMAIIAVVIFIAAFKAVGWSFADVNTQLSAIDPNLVQPFNESGLYSLSGVIAMPFYLFVSLVANPYCTIRLMAMTNVGRKSFKKFGLTLISVGMICMLMYNVRPVWAGAVPQPGRCLQCHPHHRLEPAARMGPGHCGRWPVRLHDGLRGFHDPLHQRHALGRYL